MKKRILLIFMTLLFCCVLAFSACDSEHVHDFTEKETSDLYAASAATCKSAARYYYSCACGEKGTETFEEGDLGEHTFSEWKVIKTATCVSMGERCRVCIVCGSFPSEIIPADSNAHNYAGDWMSDGESHWQVCQNTGCTSTDTAEHVFGEWVVDTEATCFKAGKQHQVCTVCEKSVSETIPADSNAHNYAGDWMSNDESHWLGCQNIGCTAITEKTAHNLNEEGVCTACQKNLAEGIKFVLQDDGTYKVSGYTGSATVVAIPSLYNGSAVTRIDDYAFRSCFALNAITIPASVKEIGTEAFKNCSKLKTVTFLAESQLLSIGDDAFYGCEQLTSATLPASVTNIGEDAFLNCRRLTSITVEQGNTKYHSAGNCLIETASKALILGCMNSIIPTDGSVTSIGAYAFYNCDGFESIMIPESVTSIGAYAFYDCDGLESIMIPESVTSIGAYAFYDCDDLRSITIPNGVTSIGDRAFYDCGNLKSVTIPESVTSIGDRAFWYCDDLAAIHYGGTMAQWSEIVKGTYWDDYTPTYTVYCIDGNVSK